LGVRARWANGAAIQRPMHPLVGTVLLRRSWVNALVRLLRAGIDAADRRRGTADSYRRTCSRPWGCSTGGRRSCTFAAPLTQQPSPCPFPHRISKRFPAASSCRLIELSRRAREARAATVAIVIDRLARA
jgi:hypothetical protein